MTDVVAKHNAVPAAPEFWRSLEERAQTPEFLEQLQREFPRHASELASVESRRRFLQLMAASLGLAGLNGCLRPPDEKIVPYVRQPEDFIPGRPLHYATCLTRGGYASGVLVESHLGRPTKIEGNPDHPASLGAADIFSQASILSLYDPDRSQTVLHAGQISTWGQFLTALAGEMTSLRKSNGQGLAILTETVTSPTLADQLQSLLAELPAATWHQWEPVGRDNVRAGSQLAFGEHVDTIFHFDQADVVLALDADFLAGMPGNLRYARDFASRRRAVSLDSSTAMNRLYAVESAPGLVGAAADHLLPMKARDIERVTRQIAARLGISEGGDSAEATPVVSESWLNALISDLQTHPGASLVIAGDGQPAAVHALAHAINRQLKNVGTTVEYVAPVEPDPVDQLGSLKTLIERMEQGAVNLVVVLGGNPVYSSLGELNFASAFQRVPLRIHLSDYVDETSSAAHWHIPLAHELESWGDARAYDGTATIRQPLIAPLYAGRTPHEFLSAMLGRAELTAHQLVRNFWQRKWGDEGFEQKWKRSVHDGVVAETRAESRTPIWKWKEQSSTEKLSPTSSTAGLEITFSPDPTIGDGRFANNGWLQELPKPLTKITWENVAQVSPATAARLGIANREIIELSLADRTLRIPAWITPGQPDDSIGLTLGYGRTRSGRIGTGIGVDVSSLRPAQHAWSISGAQLRTTGAIAELAVTQTHHSMEGRDLIPVRTLTEWKENPDFLNEERRRSGQLPTLYPEYAQSENAWGMVIDQSTCIGCNACIVACQAENNIPIVGKEQVSVGREMHWLRIDRYYRGDLASPETCFQPVMCVHCENAPCELVCPVAATVHSHEGLNQMVYNRCVGTRYCSNNCPYKVRRFNFLNYDAEMGNDAEQAPVLKLLRNPDVTVRSRGVMEKCTYCVQRINQSKIAAEKAGRLVRDGEIQTACQQTCPVQAIIFGNVADSQSRVSSLKQSSLNYSLLGELNTRPRTTHLAKIRNPHPDLEPRATSDAPAIEPTPVDRWRDQRAQKDHS